MKARFDAYQLTELPFAPVTRERAAALWADRRLTSNQLQSAIEDWTLNRGSTINLLWADLGAGKTHTLYRIEALCVASERLVPLYVLLPATVRKFQELYVAIADAIDWPSVGRALTTKPFTRAGRNLVRALKWLDSATDVRHQGLAERWLHGDRLTQRQCEELGVTQWINDTEAAIEVLRLALTCLSEGKKRVVLMIDEYQRVAEGNRSQLQGIGHAIHTLYNACPRDFTLLLSCAMGSYQDYSLVLTPEIRNRLSLFRIELPYLSAADVKDYVGDLIKQHRTSPPLRNSYFPFTDGAVELLAAYLLDVLDGGVTPRAVNQLFSLALLDGPTGNEEIDRAETETWLHRRGAGLKRQLREMT